MQIENLFTPDKIRTYSGSYIDPFNPDPDLILIEDIAHGLANTPRFRGQTAHALSVGYHSIKAAQLCPPEHRLEALLHDASEAYIGDIASPVKKRLPDFIALENVLMTAIGKKFGFPWPSSEVVKRADLNRLHIEWDRFFIGKKRQHASPAYIEDIFLQLFEAYRGEDRDEASFIHDCVCRSIIED